MTTRVPATKRWRLRHVVLLLAGIALFAGFIALGTWQVERRAWKLALMERVDQRVHAAPTPAPAAAEWPGVNAASHEYLPIFRDRNYTHGLLHSIDLQPHTVVNHQAHYQCFFLISTIKPF